MKEYEQPFEFEAPAKIGKSRRRNDKSGASSPREPVLLAAIECRDPRFTNGEQQAFAFGTPAKTRKTQQRNTKSGIASTCKPVGVGKTECRDPRLMMKEEQQAFAPAPPAKTDKSWRPTAKTGSAPHREPSVWAEIEGRDRRFMRRPEVEAITGWSRSTLYRQIAAKAFPAPVKLSSNTVGFLASEVFAWIEERLACRENDETTGEHA